VVQVQADEQGVAVRQGHAFQGLLDCGAAALDFAVRQGREDLGVALAGDDGRQDVAGRLGPGQRVHH
jgi:hypothetical protein